MLLSLLVVATARAQAQDLIIADFEGEDYGAWKTTGDAFGQGPARGTLPNQMPVEGFEGRGLVNSFLRGDATTGTLTSPEFTIERPFLNFLIGGGMHENQTCINLHVDGKVVRTATGPNDRPGGSERLEWHAWDVAEFRGKKAMLQIVDSATGGWGHINVDQILQSQTRRGTTLLRREFVVDQDYLSFPVKTGASKRRVRLCLKGDVVREFEIELDADGDFRVTSDVRPFRGQTLVVESKLPFDSPALQSIELTDTLPAAASDRRPQFHFTSRRGWLNDPNGLVYAHGEWHLFYQHNPYGWNWGNMHWGHAVSRDLLNWQELPTALYPRAWGDWAFSGSAVVDEKNTAGFQTGTEPALIAAYTSTGRGECLAYSNDRGRTWTDYAKNPVVRHAGRDPKVFWHEPTRRWVMAVYDEPANQERGIAFHTSPDLKAWTFTSRIGGFYECPDLLAISYGDPAQTAWILYGADGKYLVGDFDGGTFHPRSAKQQVWHGNFYAAQTFNNVPDGRHIQIGWANGVTFPGQPFNQQMTIPVELTLRATDTGPRLNVWPVREVETLRRAHSLTEAARSGEIPAAKRVTLVEGELDAFDLVGRWDMSGEDAVRVLVRGTPLVLDPRRGTLQCRNVTAPVTSREGQLELRVIGDRGSLEIFVNGGQTAMSIADTPTAGAPGLVVEPGPSARIRELMVFDLQKP